MTRQIGKPRYSTLAALALLAAFSGPASILASGLDPVIDAWSVEPADALRAVVLVDGENDLVLLRRLQRLGINTIVTGTGPSVDTARAAQAAGISYIAYISAADVARLPGDTEYLAQIGEVASIESFRGFHYLDETITEGYASPALQEKTYSNLKRLFPSKLVLFPFRLDLVEIEPSFLDDYFRPEFTDLVTPYFYPIGTTTLGTFQYADGWQDLLTDLLARLRTRMPPGKGLLPVLQAFEQIGYPVERGFAERQLGASGALWPSNRNFCLFAWGPPFSTGGEFLTLNQSSGLLEDFKDLLQEAASPASPSRQLPY